MRNPSAVSDRSGSSQLLGILLIAGGIAWLTAASGLAEVPLQAVVAGFLMLLGLGMLVTKTSGIFVLIGGLIIVFLATGSSSLGLASGGFEGVGERVVNPQRITALAPEYSMGAGTFILDLTDMQIPDGVTSVEARLGVGELVVIVPRGVGVEGEAYVVGGEVKLFGATLGSGITVGTDLNRPSTSSSTLRLDLNLGFGTVEIRRGF